MTWPWIIFVAVNGVAVFIVGFCLGYASALNDLRSRGRLRD